MAKTREALTVDAPACDLAAAADGAPLPARFHRLMRVWYWLGWPAFAAVLAIFWLMVAKPIF